MSLKPEACINNSNKNSIIFRISFFVYTGKLKIQKVNTSHQFVVCFNNVRPLNYVELLCLFISSPHLSNWIQTIYYAVLSHTCTISYMYDDTTSTDLLLNHHNAITLQDVSSLKSTDPIPSFFYSFSDFRRKPFSLLDLTVPSYQSLN